MAGPVSSAIAKDYAATALNIIPSGQYGSITPPNDPYGPASLNGNSQALLYDGLTPLFDNVQTSDLTKYFKSEKLRHVGTDGPARPRRPAPPRASRSPATPTTCPTSTRPPTTAASGPPAGSPPRTVACSSQQARYNARVAAIDAPGLSAIGLITQLKNFVPSAQTEDVVAKQTEALQTQGKEGKAVLARHRHLHLRHQRLPRDPQPVHGAVHPQRHLRPQRAQGPVPRPGRRRRGPPLAVPRRPAEAPRREEGLERLQRPAPVQEPGVPTTIDGKFPYGRSRRRRKGSVVLDPGSYVDDPGGRRTGRSPIRSRRQPAPALRTR